MTSQQMNSTTGVKNHFTYWNHWWTFRRRNGLEARKVNDKSANEFENRCEYSFHVLESLMDFPKEKRSKSKKSKWQVGKWIGQQLWILISRTGSLDGAVDGTEVGTELGESVGLLVGLLLGDDVGPMLTAMVGTLVGVPDGTTEGTSLGTVLGISEGA